MSTEHIRGSGQFVGTPTVDVDGTFTVPLSDNEYFAHVVGPCWLSDGYVDFSAGAAITIENGTGKTSVGKLFDPYESGSYCIFPFEVDDVVIADGDYVVAFSHRGSMVFTLAELREGLALGIGDALE